jgi:hypothetical protein
LDFRFGLPKQTRIDAVPAKNEAVMLSVNPKSKIQNG